MSCSSVRQRNSLRWLLAPNVAATLAEKPFWLILGLVVLSWLMLAAEVPRADL